MCVSTGAAEFSGTTAYCGRLHHAEHGLIHVLGYQNTAANLADGPNAMLLHLPARRLTARNFVAASRAGGVLQRMVAAVEPVEAVMSWAPPVQVFDHDVYTVLLAEDPFAIPAALAQVPGHRRPAIAPELLAFYAEHFPGHTIAVCCFDNADARRAKPLLLWYPPLDPDRLSVPAVDCHTGAAPDLDADVPVDHWVLFATDEAAPDWGAPLRWPDTMRHKLRVFLPGAVTGRHYEGTLPNGDFAISHADLLAGELDRVTRA